MKERPILFSGTMVRATLEDRKTQTRRAIKKLEGFGAITSFGKSDTPGYEWTFRDKRMLWNDITNDRLMDCCPYGKPGDRLWVRETFSIHPKAPDQAVYKADGDSIGCGKWKPSIHMPRWASRILLEIVSIRIERLQDISENDARAEGALWMNCFNAYDGTYKRGFESLWMAINGVKSWSVNPYVWVIEFKVAEVRK